MQIEPASGLHDLARRIVADQRRQASGRGDQRGQIDAGVVAHQVERVDDFLAAHVAARTRRVRAAADAAERRVETAHLDAQLELAARKRGRGLQPPRQRSVARQADEIEFERVGERHRRALRERMPARHDEHQTVLAVRRGLQPEGRHRVGHDAEIRRAVDHRERDLLAVLLVELDADGRIGRVERGDVGGQELRDRRRVRPQPHDADDTGGIVRHVGRHQVDVVQDALREALQRLAGHGQRDAARVPLEQPGAGRRFEIRDPLAGGADREMRQLGALADAAAAHDEREQRQRDEIETMQVHARRLRAR